MVNTNFEEPWNYGFSIAIVTTGEFGTPGYLIKDINGDGIDELILGQNVTGSELYSTWDSIIYNIYSMSDGAPVQVLNGWERNRYYLCENGIIANEGISGAGNSNYSYFTFKESKLYLVESVIYDGMRDADNPWFYSTKSVYDAEDAEPINEERATEIRKKYTYERLAFIPFAGDN